MGIKIQSNTNKTDASKTTFDLNALLTKEISIFGNSFSNAKKEQWYGELSVLLKSGIDLKSGLELLVATQKKEKDQQLMQGIVVQLVAGSAFSSIIKAHKSFTSYEYHALKIGEQTGQLAQITEELSEFFKRKNELRRQVIAALTYPVIVLLTAVVVVGFMLRFVVPMFVDIFKQNKVDLPPITKAIVWLAQVMGSHGWLILILILIGGIGLVLLSKQPWFRKIMGAVQLKLPILGAYFKTIYLSQFTQAMAVLTTAKVSMTESVNLVSTMINCDPLQRALAQVHQTIVSGASLSHAFAEHSIFDKKMIAMIRVAEETNQTAFIFQKLNEQYNQQVQYQSQVISNVLNPILTILVAIIVGIILIAMYLPMFKLSSVIG